MSLNIKRESPWARLFAYGDSLFLFIFIFILCLDVLFHFLDFINDLLLYLLAKFRIVF